MYNNNDNNNNNSGSDIVWLVNKVVLIITFTVEMNIRTVNARELEGPKTCQLKNMRENTRL